MQRFHLSPLPLQKDLLILEDKQLLHQMIKVLRMRPKDFFHVFNKQEGEFLCQIESVDKKKVIARKIKAIKNQNDPRLKAALYQAIPKKIALFEWVVQKATEIGVDAIFPLITERTENRRLPKFERLNHIAKEATEQCRRLHIPIIHHPVDFNEVVGDMKGGYMAYESESKKYLSDYKNQIKKQRQIQLIIGPEGGFSQKEITLARQSNITSFSLGKRILRTETAAIVSLGLLLLNDVT